MSPGQRAGASTGSPTAHVRGSLTQSGGSDWVRRGIKILEGTGLSNEAGPPAASYVPTMSSQNGGPSREVREIKGAVICYRSSIQRRWPEPSETSSEHISGQGRPPR